MDPALRNANTRYTYADYLTWPEDVRYELIDGVPYPMSPAPDGVAYAMPRAPLRLHQELLGAIYREAANALDGQPCRPFIAPFDVRLPHANEADGEIDTVVQPDLVVVCDRSKLDERGCRGAPGAARTAWASRWWRPGRQRSAAELPRRPMPPWLQWNGRKLSCLPL